MNTKFTKISSKDVHMPKWSNFFTAGDAWLLSLQVLEDNREKIAWGVFYVSPWVVAFCLELFIKAIAAHENDSFNGNNYRHRTTDILKDYKNKILIFQKIFKDKKLFNLIKEYENTIDTKFGETYVSVDGKDQKRLIETIHELRDEICKRTGLR